MINRTNIYYWKCDRPSAFRSLKKDKKEKELQLIEQSLQILLKKKFNNTPFTLNYGSGQGIHLTFLAVNNGRTYFIRIEDGPE